MDYPTDQVGPADYLGSRCGKFEHWYCFGVSKNETLVALGGRLGELGKRELQDLTFDYVLT